MSYSFNGTSDRLFGSFASTYADAPLTLAAFIKVPAHPLAQGSILHFGINSGSSDGSFYLRSDIDDNNWNLVARTTTNSSAIVVLDIDGVWAGYVGVITADNLRDLYVQSLGSTGQDTAVRNITNALQHISVGSSLVSTVFFPGKIAELVISPALWNSDTIAAYLARLRATALGVPLAGYWPLSAAGATQENQGSDTGGDLTVSGATFDSDHPIIMDAPKLFQVRSNLYNVRI